MPTVKTLLQAPVTIATPVARGSAPLPAPLPAPTLGVPLGPSPSASSLTPAARSATIASFSAPSLANAQGKLLWREPGSTARFEMQVRYAGQAQSFPLTPAVYTNADRNGAPSSWRAHPMKLVGQQGDLLTYAVELPITRVGNYRATGVLLDGASPVRWASESGFQDIPLRPYALEHDRTHFNLVNVMNLGTPGEVGTFEDLLGAGSPEKNKRYSLRAMKGDGVEAVRLLPIQPRTYGPYSRTAMFEIWTDYSKPARAIRAQIEQLRKLPPTPAREQQIDALEAQRVQAALGSFRAFVDEAHALGMKVILDVVLNHVGEDLAMNDAFFLDAAGQTIDVLDTTKTAASVELRRNDPAQIAVDPAHAAQISARIEAGARGAQDAAPHLFGHWLDPDGASNKDEIADGGWFEWTKPGTWQLNHGAFREGYHWFDVAPSAANHRTRELLMREMAMWVLQGVDGFRVDHGTGMPHAFFQEDLNRLQAVADKYRPGTHLYIETEDFHTHGKTIPSSDTVELGGFRALLGARGPAELRAAFDAPWRQNSGADAGNHDEGSAMLTFGGDHRAYGRFMALESLLGGPNGRKMGDEYGELGGLDFRGSGTKLWTLSNSTPETREVHGVVGRAGRAKRNLDALHHRDRHWLREDQGSWHPDILAAARFDGAPGRASSGLAVVVANFRGDHGASGRFRLTPEAAAKLEPQGRYMAYDHMAKDKYRPLWSAPKTGQELADGGVHVELGPYQVQALDLAPMKLRGGEWVPERREREVPSLPIPPSIKVL